jgi:hypothetical protein
MLVEWFESALGVIFLGRRIKINNGPRFLWHPCRSLNEILFSLLATLAVCSRLLYLHSC